MNEFYTYNFPLLFALISICQSWHQLFFAPSFIISHFLNSLMVIFVITLTSSWRWNRSFWSDVICQIKITNDIRYLNLIEFSRYVFNSFFILNWILSGWRSLSKTDRSPWAWVLIWFDGIIFSNVRVYDIFWVDDGINVLVCLEFQPVIVMPSRDKNVFQ